MFQTEGVEKIKTDFCVEKLFFWVGGGGSVPFVRRRGIVVPGRLQMTIWPLRVACWVPKATNKHTLRICNTHWFSTVTMVLRTPLIVMLYVHFLSV